MVAVVVGACGSDDGGSTGTAASTAAASTTAETTGGDSTTADTGGDAQSAAKANIDANSKIPEFKLQAEPVDISKAKGKTVFNIPVASTIPYVAAVDAQMKKVAEANGVKFIQFENEGNPTQWAAGINQAINQKVDLIVLQAGRPAAGDPAAQAGQGGRHPGPRVAPVSERPVAAGERRRSDQGLRHRAVPRVGAAVGRLRDRPGRL